MYFKLNIEISENDYIDFNNFTMLKTSYGKSQILKSRIILALIFGIMALSYLIRWESTINALVGSILFTIILILSQLFLKPWYAYSIKGTAKSLINHSKKNGKPPYSPVSKMEFYDETFIETAPNEKTELKYSLIERITIISGSMIYLFRDTTRAYLIPVRCFASKEEGYKFIDFIKTKCQSLEIYDQDLKELKR